MKPGDSNFKLKHITSKGSYAKNNIFVFKIPRSYRHNESSFQLASLQITQNEFNEWPANKVLNKIGCLKDESSPFPSNNQVPEMSPDFPRYRGFGLLPTPNYTPNEDYYEKTFNNTSNNQRYDREYSNKNERPPARGYPPGRVKYRNTNNYDNSYNRYQAQATLPNPEYSQFGSEMHGARPYFQQNERPYGMNNRSFRHQHPRVFNRRNNYSRGQNTRANSRNQGRRFFPKNKPRNFSKH